MLAVKNVIFLFIRSQTAESGPPLGTVLGNIGINALKFCKEFNEFTIDLPSYFLLKVKILIMEDRSYSFLIFPPTTGFILNFVKYQQILKINFKVVTFSCISLKNVVLLAKFKFPLLPLPCSIRLIIGSVHSSKLMIVL